MSQFLLIYRRSSGTLLALEELGTDRTKAQLRRRQLERSETFDSDVEVVVLNANSEEDLRRTHSRYFSAVPELAQQLADKLPESN